MVNPVSIVLDGGVDSRGDLPRPVVINITFARAFCTGSLVEPAPERRECIAARVGGAYPAGPSTAKEWV
jgi:hypothetical protein